jgi:hypothetical protein
MKGSAPSACVALRPHLYVPKAPLVYWMDGARVRRFFQAEKDDTSHKTKAGTAVATWQDSSAVGHTLLLDQKSLSYDEAFRIASGELGDQPIDLYARPLHDKSFWVLYALIRVGNEVKRLWFDPETGEHGERETLPVALNAAGVSLTAACEVDADNVLVFGTTSSPAASGIQSAACWVWNTDTGDVSDPSFSIPRGMVVDAAFLGHDQQIPPKPAKPRHVVRLYQGDTESAFTVTVGDGVAPVFVPAPGAGNFLESLPQSSGGAV